MAIDPIAGSHLDPLKANQIFPKVGAQSSNEETVPVSNESQGDTVQISERAKELAKYATEIETIPTPNEGRLEELKEAIASGDYPSKDILDQTASILAQQLL